LRNSGMFPSCFRVDAIIAIKLYVSGVVYSVLTGGHCYSGELHACWSCHYSVVPS